MKKIKIFVDIAMFIITILLMDINRTGRFYHEVLGISLTLLLFLHIIFNLKWVKQITKNFKKVKRQTKTLYIIDTLLFLVYLITIILGLSTSSFIFHLKIKSPLKWMFFHHLFGRLAFIFMLIHLGFHLSPFINKITKSETIKTIIYIVYITITILVALVLFYQLTKTYLWTSVMG